MLANSVSQTTVTPTVNDSGATYVIKLGGVTDADGVVSLSVGRNDITIEVTAEDDDTTQTYTVAVTRASPSSDATLSALTLSSIDFGTFASGTTSYSAQCCQQRIADDRHSDRERLGGDLRDQARRGDGRRRRCFPSDW